MKRTTIFVPEELERDLQLYAEREGKPVAAVVREAIAAYIVRGPAARALPLRTLATTDRRHFAAVRPSHVDRLTLVP